MAIKSPQLFLSFLASAAFLVASNLNAATTSVVGYTSTTLPAGAGNLYAPAFVNSDSFVGTLTGATAGETSTLTLSGTVTANAFDETQDDPGVSKGYPQYYVEVLNDTNAGDSIDTEGLIIDIESNTTSTLDVAADISTLGIQGDEQVAIRKHLSLSDIFSNSSGATAVPVTIYNEDGPGTAVTHFYDGVGGFVLGTDFTTVTSDAPVYPGTGFVVNNSSGPVTITPSGLVKETDTQVVVYGNSVVNIVSSMTPQDNIELSNDGRLNEVLNAGAGFGTLYKVDGSLIPDGDTFTDNGSGTFVSSRDFTTEVTVSVDGTHEPLVVNSAGGGVYKVKGVVIP